MDSYEVVAIGVVEGGRVEAVDDNWGDIESVIEIDPARFTEEVVHGLDHFSHVDVVFLFHEVDEDTIHLGSRHPRERDDWPLVGIFAQRAKARPNRIGVTTCELVSVDGLRVHVRGLDAIEGTPVLDLKPHVREFAPRTPVTQPDWITELMDDYW